MNSSVPNGWRVLEYSEGLDLKPQLNQFLSDWSIVAFKTGKLDGFKYGNKFMESYGSECGERFIIKID